MSVREYKELNKKYWRDDLIIRRLNMVAAVGFVTLMVALGSLWV